MSIYQEIQCGMEIRKEIFYYYSFEQVMKQIFGYDYLKYMNEKIRKLKNRKEEENNSHL